MLDLSSLEKASQSLEQLLIKTEEFILLNNQDEIIINGLKSGVIQNFEFTYELAWKFMKRWIGQNLGYNYVDGVARRELYRVAFENQLINDIDLWMEYHFARNLTVHTYSQETSNEVYLAAKKFSKDVLLFFDILRQKNV